MNAEELTAFEEADLVLGGDEGDERTYSKGYMKRQAIFSCLTCTPNGNAGICTACCWFHEEHICQSPPDETIWAAGGHRVPPFATSKDKSVMEDIPPIDDGAGQLENGVYPDSSQKDNMGADAKRESVSDVKKFVIGESSQNDGISSPFGSIAGTPATCIVGVDWLAASVDLGSKPLFLSKNWRDALCRCDKCLDMYKEKHISYLLDKEDSIAEYEKNAKQKREEKLQRREGAELNFFNNLGHVEKMEILNGIADFTDEFRSFLGSVDPSKAITEADVNQIFENLKNKKAANVVGFLFISWICS
ncbi:hypothetical protein F3Y22_tig00110777pilonHSYRG00177 [Hibiscus syriacus]|uniref:UBR-type domain-containing protein n=1 Tax=Hibiscus syriacus TaxID=106335 RepID=A0A6A2ZRH1_HIBSY|nr:hypothetical protein F3Y22_tig00110777pilonHSYRG00177 [Hibiscus syriacus]